MAHRTVNNNKNKVFVCKINNISNKTKYNNKNKVFWTIHKTNDFFWKALPRFKHTVMKAICVFPYLI